MTYYKNLRLWLYGLLSTTISAAAGSIVMIGIDPNEFNFTTGWRKLGAVALVMGVLSLANYLQKHPLPELVEDPHVGGV